MSGLTEMLVLQSRMHKKHGANALSQLFDSATERIEELEANLKLRKQDVHMLQCEIGDMCEVQGKLEAENEELKCEIRERSV